MSLLSLCLIALSLAMDAFAVSVSAGFTAQKVRLLQALSLALVFGIFQAIMPLLGWLGGKSIASYIEPVDHWIAFGLLSVIGVNMIREALSGDDEEKRDYFSIKSLLTLGVATSIDALAVGISFALLPVDIVVALLLIGGITFSLCFAGVYLGARFGHIFGNKALVIGGLILIGIGSEILFEHLGIL